MRYLLLIGVVVALSGCFTIWETPETGSTSGHHVTSGVADAVADVWTAELPTFHLPALEEEPEPEPEFEPPVDTVPHFEPEYSEGFEGLGIGGLGSGPGHARAPRPQGFWWLD